MKDIEIIHVDSTFLVINKPSGLLSVPGRGPQMSDCVVSRVKALYPGGLQYPEVHRLDMDTSGLMVLALTSKGQRCLANQFQERLVEKKYIALLDGIIEQDEGEIELAFRLDPDNRPHQVYDPVQGKTGHTKWRKLGVEDGQTRIRFVPLTGRTHQLRVHSAHELGLGCPIAGDRLYGNGTAPGQLKLHACWLAFNHPETGERVSFSVPPEF